MEASCRLAVFLEQSGQDSLGEAFARCGFDTVSESEGCRLG